MTEWQEALKGFTDLPIAALAGVFAVLLWRQKGRREPWAWLFFLTALAGVLGCIVHVAALSPALYNLLWTALYPLLYAAIGLFARLLCREISDNPVPERAALLHAVMLCPVNLVWLYLLPETDIYVLVAFGALELALVAACIVQARRIPARVAVLLGLLAATVLLQALAAVIPFAVVAEHLLLLAALCVVYGFGL